MLSPDLFSLYWEAVIDGMENWPRVLIGGININRYADWWHQY